MKKTFTLSLLLLLSIIVTAQETVTLRFTSTTPSGSYYPFDVVNVTNVTRGWTESLAYPDTTMVLTSYDGIQDNYCNGGFLSEVYPNPLSGNANVMFGMTNAGEIDIKVMDINGCVISSHKDYLEMGTHQITINMSKPQMAFLVVKTNDNQYVKKILNIGYGDGNSISINRIADGYDTRNTYSGGEFVIGDVMSYVAVSFYNGDMLESQRITKAQYDDELIMLLFNVNPNPTPPTVTTAIVTNVTHNSAVAGGNVIDSGGASVAERGVCWSTSPNPTASGNHIAASTSGTGSFVCNVTGLTPATTYYLRAYAINSVGPSYGNEESFTTIIESPIVVMDSINSITTTSAMLYANVLDDGGATVYPKGFCWSTNPNPTTSDSYSTNGWYAGPFNHNITGLTDNTLYYVRAYATNSVGTTYSEQMSFTTGEMFLPTVTTNEMSFITTNSAICGGNVINSGDGNITARGVCWSVNQNPTTTNSHTSDGTGVGNFTSNITGLTYNTTYYLRAYATNEKGTSYGGQVTFKTLYDGTIPGLFSVSYFQRVYFSKGNLQYSAESNTWRFAPNQYDYIGSNNMNISWSYPGWIDLFGWGTSGYDHGAICYQPWSTYSGNERYFAYGNENYHLYNQTGMADWGYNAISNGGNSENVWRTLTKDEWAFVINLRETNSGIRYAKAMVNGVNGVILLPDNWNSETYSLNNTNMPDASYSTNNISQTDWMNIFEVYGAVFLPTAGYRYSNSQVNHTAQRGYYWSANQLTDQYAWRLLFQGNDVIANDFGARRDGHSVRLVIDAE